jgi:hypothetical protein
MTRGRGHYRKPDLLLLLAAAVVLCALVTTAATAGETVNFFPRSAANYQVSSQENEGFSLASMGDTGGVLRVSLTPPPEHVQDFVDSGASTQRQDTFSHVFVFLRYPW